MSRVTAYLIEEHRRIEVELDRLADAIRSGEPADQFRVVARLARAHYRTEEPFLQRLSEISPVVGAKMSMQHADGVEIASRLEEAIGEGNRRDVLLLARRFHALVQHNIIEEERDVFPLADRSFSPADNARLCRRFSGIE